MRRTFQGEHVTMSKQLQDLGILEVEVFSPKEKMLPTFLAILPNLINVQA